MESTSSSYDAASSSSSSSTRRHRCAGRRPAKFLQGAEPCASSSSDPAEHVSGRRTRHGHDNDYSKRWNMPPFDWIKAFLVALFVLQAISSSDALTPVESVWQANDTHGTDHCTSERRCKRHLGNKQHGKPCWTEPWAADADHEDLLCSSDNAGEVVQWSGRQHDDDNVPPVPSSRLEGSLLALQSEDESMDTSSSSTITNDGLLGGEDDVTSMETDHADDADSVISGHTSIPDAMDGSMEEIAGLDSSREDASAGAEQPAVDGQMNFVPLSSVPGLRFVPTDLEIVLHWLKRKILNSELPEHDTVREGVDVHRTNADQITLDIDDGGKERLGFFFVRKEHGYTNGCWYPTPGGYWKVRQGQPAAIWDGGRVVAFKTSMEYVRGRAPHGRRTPWRMSEYALNACYHDLTNPAQPTMNSFVVCKVWKRTSNDVKKKTSVLRRFGLQRWADKDDRAPKPKVRRLVRGGARGQKLGKRKRPES